MLCLLAPGCLSSPPGARHVSQVEVPARFAEPAAGQAPVPEAQLRQWWQVWQDPLLDRLITEALASSTDLRRAQAEVLEARAMVTVAESALYPTVAAGGAVWGGAADWRLPAPLSSAGPAVHAEQGGLGARWEPDVFGRARNDAAAAQALALGAQERLAGTRLAVVADLAENYQEARGLQRRLAVLDDGIARLEELLRYTRGRFQSGETLAYDVDRVQEELDHQRAQRPGLESLLAMRQRRIRVLTGRPPEDLADLSGPGSLTVPPVPGGALPGQVLERRPDVRARASGVEAAARRLSKARADLLPRFGIQFLGGDGELRLAGLPGLGAGGGLASFSAHLPLFTAGRIRAQIAASDARLVAAVADYDGTLLAALAEVENAYRARQGLDERSASLAAALAAARRNVQTVTTLYEAGRKTLEDVLRAKLAALKEEDELIQSDMGRASATVQLFRALGGGW